MADTLTDAIRAECEKLVQYKADGFESVPLAVLQKSLLRIAAAAEPFTDWLSEGEAKLRSDRSSDWLRGQFAALEDQGLARWNPNKPKQRQFLRAAVPLRANPAAARDAGRNVVVGA